MFSLVKTLLFDEALTTSRANCVFEQALNYVNDAATSDSIGLDNSLDLDGLSGAYPQEHLLSLNTDSGALFFFSSFNFGMAFRESVDGIDFSSVECAFDVPVDLRNSNFYYCTSGGVYFFQHNRPDEFEIDRYISSDGVNFEFVETVPLVFGVNYFGVAGSAVVGSGNVTDRIAAFVGINGDGFVIVSTETGFDWSEDSRFNLSDATNSSAFCVNNNLLFLGLGLNNSLIKVDLIGVTVETIAVSVFENPVAHMGAILSFNDDLYVGVSQYDSVSDAYPFYIYQYSADQISPTSGNQSITGGGLNGQGGAIGFSGVAASNSSGISLASLAYPAGIVPRGVNDFGIDLGL